MGDKFVRHYVLRKICLYKLFRKDPFSENMHDNIKALLTCDEIEDNPDNVIDSAIPPFWDHWSYEVWSKNFNENVKL